MYETTRTGQRVDVGGMLRGFSSTARDVAEAYAAYETARASNQPTEEPRRVYEDMLGNLQTGIRSLRNLGIIELE